MKLHRFFKALYFLYVKAIVKNFTLAFLISFVALVGAVGKKPHSASEKLSHQEIAVREAEETKESLTLFGVAGLAWVLCFWRCAATNRRLSAERFYQQRFNEYMKTLLFSVSIVKQFFFFYFARNERNIFPLNCDKV